MRMVMVLVSVFGVAFACGKSGGDPNIVSCSGMNIRLSRCVTELGFSQENVPGTPRVAAQVLAEVLSGPIGSDCGSKSGKLDNGAAINACLAKSSCIDVAACFVQMGQ